MKNRVSNYLTKVSNNQIKMVTDRKKLIENDAIRETYKSELTKIYWFEKELLITIPMLIHNAKTIELVESLTLLCQHTEDHVKQLENSFPDLVNTNEPKKYDIIPYKKII